MKLFFREYGSGDRVLLILHGLFGLSDNWVTLGKRFAEQYRVIIPDLRNHGQSMHSDVFTYEAMLSDIEELMDDLDIIPCDVMGHSMGGKVAMHLALKQPEYVNRLVVADISPVSYPPVKHTAILDIIHSLDFEKLKTRTDIEQYIAAATHDKGFQGLILKNIVRLRDDRFVWKLNVKAISENISSIFDFGVPAHLHFDKPTLFLRGADSDYILDAHQEAIKSYFPSYKLETIENASHWLHAEQPEQFFEKVHSFLQ